MAKIRIGVIGLGMAVTPHAQSLVDLRDKIEVAYAFSRSPARRAAFAQRFPFPLTDDIDTILGDDAVAAVMVLTPPNTHLEIIRRCAAAGKHVLLEKPLEITTERAAELVEICRRAGVKLGMVLQHRYRPAAVELREILASGRLGEIAGVSTFIRLWRPQSYYDEPGRGDKLRDGGGVLLTQGIHTLDLMLHLAGPIEEVSAYARTSPLHRMETEDMVCGAARFANGALGTIDATTTAYPGFPEKIEIIARNGTALLAGTELKVLFHDGSEQSIASDNTAGGTGADPMAFPNDYHRSVLSGFVDALAAGREPPVSGASALAVHRLIDALLASADSGRRESVGA